MKDFSEKAIQKAIGKIRKEIENAEKEMERMDENIRCWQYEIGDREQRIQQTRDKKSAHFQAKLKAEGKVELLLEMTEE